MAAEETQPAEVIVAGHVCLDVIPQFLSGQLPPPGALAEVGPVTVSTGGSVSNTGIALHRLGLGVRLVGRVGDDAFGREVRRLYDLAGPGLSQGLEMADDAPTSYTVVVNPIGEDRRFLHCPGANATFRADHVPDAALEAGQLFHFGYPPIMREACAGDGRELRELFERARLAGLMTSLDMCGIDPASWAGQVDWEALFANVLPAVDLFLPSLDETLAALGRSESPNEPTVGLLREISDQLLGLGAAAVGLKMGERGVYLRTTSDAARLKKAKLDPALWTAREVWAPTFEREVVGTTGAGDVTIAGFLAAVVRGAGPERALDIACAAGAACVIRPDATSGVCDLAEIDRFLASCPRRRVPPETSGWSRTVSGLFRSAHDHQ